MVDQAGIEMKWTERVRAIKVWDMVAYGRPFLQSISCHTGSLPQATGKVIASQEVSDNLIVVETEWDRPDMPTKVNFKNLSRFNRRAHGSHD